MEIKIRFNGGPLHGTSAMTDGLDECKVFFDDRQRQVTLYSRIDELVYQYDHTVSTNLSAMYDEAKKELLAAPTSNLRVQFEEDAGDGGTVAIRHLPEVQPFLPPPLEFDPFSDSQLIDEDDASPEDML
jgi:hypothetical protein